MGQEKNEPKNIAKKKQETTTISEEKPTRYRISSYLSSQLHRPRGRPPRHKTNETSNLSSQP